MVQDRLCLLVTGRPPNLVDDVAWMASTQRLSELIADDVDQVDKNFGLALKLEFLHDGVEDVAEVLV